MQPDAVLHAAPSFTPRIESTVDDDLQARQYSSRSAPSKAPRCQAASFEISGLIRTGKGRFGQAFRPVRLRHARSATRA
jgi:hypothetical protein